MCKRGDVYFADLGENIGSCKQGGFRPVLVVSNNRANEHSPVITIVPLTARVYKKTTTSDPCVYSQLERRAE